LNLDYVCSKLVYVVVAKKKSGRPNKMKAKEEWLIIYINKYKIHLLIDGTSFIMTGICLLLFIIVYYCLLLLLLVN